MNDDGDRPGDHGDPLGSPDADPTDDLGTLTATALRASVASAEASDDLWGRIRTDLGDDSSGSSGSRNEQRWRAPLLAAAVAAVLGGVGIALADGGDDATVSTPADTGPDPAVPTTVAPTTVAEPEPPIPDVPADPPNTIVGADANRVFVFDGATGAERTLVDLGNEDTGAEVGSLVGVDSLELTPDGTSVLVGTCCEPAAGEIFTVPLDTGRVLGTDDLFLGGFPRQNGVEPRFSPDGTMLAVAAYEGLTLTEVATGAELATFPYQPGTAPTHVVWRPDGQRLLLSWRDLGDIPGGPRPLVEVELRDGGMVQVNDGIGPDEFPDVAFYGRDGDRLRPDRSTFPNSEASPPAAAVDRSGGWLLAVPGDGEPVVHRTTGGAVELPGLDGLPEAFTLAW